MQLNWVRRQNRDWCDLFGLDLEQPYFENRTGVYVIWWEQPVLTVARVGQGLLRDSLRTHRRDACLQREAHRPLLVTWAWVPGAKLDGVVVYLTRTLRPLRSESIAPVAPITVQLPW